MLVWASKFGAAKIECSLKLDFLVYDFPKRSFYTTLFGYTMTDGFLSITKKEKYIPIK